MNPWALLTQPQLDEPEGEEVGGQFSCQEKGCYEVAREARYLREVRILTWLCPNEHISSIKEFHIDD